MLLLQSWWQLYKHFKLKFEPITDNFQTSNDHHIKIGLLPESHSFQLFSYTQISNVSAVHSVWLFYSSMAFVICEAEGKTNVELPMLKLLPLYAEINMSNVNQQLKEILNNADLQNTVNG